MKKTLMAILALLLFIGMAAAAVDICPECFTNSIDQDDTQTIADITLGGTEHPVVFNEGLTAAVTITPAWEYPALVDAEGTTRTSTGGFGTDPAYDYAVAPFSRVEQKMVQTISTMEYQHGLMANKASQAAWTQNQGGKEFNHDTNKWDFEGSLIRQDTLQEITNIVAWGQDEAWDMNPGEQAIFNADSKLAVIGNDLENLMKTVGITSTTNNDQEAIGTYDNSVSVEADITGEGVDGEAL